MKRKRKNKMFKIKNEDGSTVMLYEDEYRSLQQFQKILSKTTNITFDVMDKASRKEGDKKKI